MTKPPASESTTSPWYRAMLVLPLLGFLMLPGLWWLLDRREADLAQGNIDADTTQAALRLEDYVGSRLLIVASLAKEAEGGLFPSEESFVPRAEALHDSLGGLLAINYILWDGTIEWVSPEGPNRLAKGRNVFAHPGAGEFAIAARDQLRPTITRGLDLFQGGRGVATYFPVVVDGSLEGFINGVFECDHLVQSSLREAYLAEYEIEVTDDDGLIYRSPGFGVRPELLEAASVRPAVVLGRRWEIKAVPNTTTMAQLRPGDHNLVLGIAAFTLVVLGLLMRAWGRSRQRSAALATERLRLAVLVETSQDLHALMSPKLGVRYLNPTGQRMLGMPAFTPGASQLEEFAVDATLMQQAVAIALDVGHWSGELELRGPKEQTVTTLARLALVSADPSKNEPILALSATDVTDQRHLEDELRHAQKMEALGRLAGGLAHDFNNLLTAVNGHAEMALVQPDLDQETRSSLGHIVDAADRGAGMTRNLLAFSRKQEIETKVFDPAERVRGLQPTLRHLVRDDVSLQMKFEDPGVRIQMDPAQLDQIIINLVVNGVDAMPDGGTLRIEGEAREQNGGWYVISVHDSGVGIDEEDQARVFEPFFTTKAPGQGTGLGLAQVWDCTARAGGRVRLDSQRGRGTRFDIWLPIKREMKSASSSTSYTERPKNPAASS